MRWSRGDNRMDAVHQVSSRPKVRRASWSRRKDGVQLEDAGTGVGWRGGGRPPLVHKVNRVRAIVQLCAGTDHPCLPH